MSREQLCMFALFCFGGEQKKSCDNWLVFENAGLTSIEYTRQYLWNTKGNCDADSFGHLHAVHLAKGISGPGVLLERSSFDHLIISDIDLVRLKSEVWLPKNGSAISVTLHHVKVGLGAISGRLSIENVFISCCTHSDRLTDFVESNLDLKMTKSFSAVNSGIKQIFPSLLEQGKNLRVLDLSGNRLTSINSVPRDSLTKLWRLDLSRNQLSEVRHDFFRDMTSLKELDLSSNHVRQLIFSAYEHLYNKLELFNLFDNPYLTESSKIWFKERFNTTVFAVKSIPFNSSQDVAPISR